MEYRHLLFSAGGGIVSTQQMDEPNKAATIAIGLGGTGISCLRNLKRQVYSRLRPDNPKDPIPTYSHIKFLAVDSDRGSLAPDGQVYDLDEATEYFDISIGNIQGLLEQPKVLSRLPECAWLKNTDEGTRGLPILSATASTGGVRQIGRLLIIEKSSAFIDKISQLINAAKEGLPAGSEVNIHIFSGLSGGTGSSIFLDVCYLIQQALKNIGEYGHALTCGYFFLPDVNLSVPEVKANSVVSHFIQTNGFAAMKELDYCMNFENNKGKWLQRYPTCEIETSDTPVNLCHLISAQTTNGAIMEKGYTYAMNVVTDYIMQFVVANEGFTLKAHIAAHFPMTYLVRKKHGANYGYCILGASNATVPMREITTYLASKLFEGMSDINEKMPSDTEIAQFAADQGLTFQGLQRSILEKTSTRMPVLQLDHTLFANMPETDLGLPDEIHLPESILGPYRALREKMLNQIEVNKQALTHEWRPDNLEESQNSISKMCSVYYALRDMVADANRGPMYAAATLKGTGRKNLVDLLNGVLVAVQDAIKSNTGDISLNMDAVKRARKNFLHPGILSNKKKLFEEFIRCLSNLETIESTVAMLRQMEGTVRILIEQFSSLYENHMKPYAQVAQNLSDTFHQNYLYLTSGTKPLQDPFVMPLMTIEDLKESLDKTVAEMKLDSEIREFHTALFNQSNIWLNSEEAKIAKFVSAYLVDRFSGYTSRTLTDYLEIKFGVTDPALLANRVYQDIMMPLSDKATPLFWKTSAFQITDASPLGYCSAPDSSAPILNAASTLLQARPELRLVPNKVPDRISILRCTCGVPLFGYNGVTTYAAQYLNDNTVGKHLYEGTSRDSRDWRQLPNLQPYSTINNPDEETEKRAADYDRAVEMGIVRQSPSNPTDYQIVVYPDFSELRAKAQAVLSMSQVDVQQCDGVIRELETYKEARQPARLIAVPNDGNTNDNKPKVRKDHVVASAEMIRVIRGNMKQDQEIGELINTLNEAKGGEIGKRRMQNDFFSALWTGVIVYRQPKVIYVKEDEFGLSEDIILSDATKTPYGRAVPLYQAFLSYCEMSQAERDNIREQADGRQNDMAPSMKEACDHLIQVFDKGYMASQQSMLKQAEADTGKVETILDFLRAFLQGLAGFRQMNGLL